MPTDLQNQHEETGRLAGVGAGAVTGAQLGTALLPIPVVGTFAGALIGGALGSELGRRIAPAVVGAIDGLLHPAQSSASAPSAQSQAIQIERESAAPPDAGELLNRLERLGSLRKQDLLTEEEFVAAKARLLGES